MLSSFWNEFFGGLKVYLFSSRVLSWKVTVRKGKQSCCWRGKARRVEGGKLAVDGSRRGRFDGAKEIGSVKSKNYRVSVGEEQAMPTGYYL